MTIKMILAVDNNNAIGKNGDLLIHNPEDMKYFKEMTLGCNVIMGRKTFDSLPFKNGLPNRKNIVLSSTNIKYPTTTIYVTSIACILSVLSILQEQLSWVIGGASIYNQLSEYVDEVHISRMDIEVEGADTFVDLTFLEDFEMDLDVKRLNDYTVVEVWKRREGEIRS